MATSHKAVTKPPVFETHSGAAWTKSSAVAVIADRTANGMQYTDKLSNQFRIIVYDPIQRVAYRL